MKITIHHNALLVYIDSGSRDEITIRNYVNKYFKNTLESTHNIVIFNRCTKEAFSRKTFLHWLYTAYIRDHKREDLQLKKDLFSALSLPIKIKFIEDKKVATAFSIHLNIVQKNNVRISIFPEGNAYLHNFIQYYFKEFIVSSQDTKNSYLIQITEQLAKDKLTQLLKRKRILNSNMTFIYNKSLMDTLLHSQHQNNHHKPLHHHPLSEAFLLLNASTTESMQDIKKKYKTLARQYHPDKVFGSDPLKVEAYTRKFQAIQQAFTSIKEHILRTA